MIAGGALIALLPILTAAQPAERIRHVGVLVHGALPSSQSWIGTALETGLRERGWIPGRNIALDYRYSEGRPERLAALATELTRLRTDLIVAHTNQAIAAAKSATATIPIVMVIAVDPVGAGFVGSLARPGGNITGLTFDVNDEIWGKRLELLREAAPGVSRVAVLWNPAYAPNRNRWKAIEEPARRLGLSLVSVEVPAGSELESRFPVMAREGARGILVYSVIQCCSGCERRSPISPSSTVGPRFRRIARAPMPAA